MLKSMKNIFPGITIEIDYDPDPGSPGNWDEPIKRIKYSNNSVPENSVRYEIIDGYCYYTTDELWETCMGDMHIDENWDRILNQVITVWRAYDNDEVYYGVITNSLTGKRLDEISGYCNFNDFRIDLVVLANVYYNIMLKENY